MNKITLIQHPTVALKLHGHPDAPEGMFLSNIYRRVMPVSLARVASVIERDVEAQVEILDLRVLNPERDELYKTVDWEGYQIETSRVGAPFDTANDVLANSDWVGFSSHFTYESGVVRDLIKHAKRVNPDVKVMVGGADVKARPETYLSFGADLVFRSDFSPEALCGNLERIVTHSHQFRQLTAPAFEKLEHLNCYTDSHDGLVPETVSTPVGFIYFTRGCPRECDFCESRESGFESLDLESAVTMLNHYKKAGITTLNFADDNLLLKARQNKREFLKLFKQMRKMGFAWEFPNGLEIGLLQNGGVDEEIMEALFTSEMRDDKFVGAYRLYVPVETFDQRGGYRKLRPVEDQNRVIQRIVNYGVPELDFGVIIPPSATEGTFDSIRDGYRAIQRIVQSGRQTRARYAIFHMVPIALFRGMETKYSVDEFPEGWHFHVPVYDGDNFTARELFDRRLELTKELDSTNYAGLIKGKYDYS